MNNATFKIGSYDKYIIPYILLMAIFKNFITLSPMKYDFPDPIAIMFISFFTYIIFHTSIMYITNQTKAKLFFLLSVAIADILLTYRLCIQKNDDHLMHVLVILFKLMFFICIIYHLEYKISKKTLNGFILLAMIGSIPFFPLFVIVTVIFSRAIILLIIKKENLSVLLVSYILFDICGVLEGNGLYHAFDVGLIIIVLCITMVTTIKSQKIMNEVFIDSLTGLNNKRYLTNVSNEFINGEVSVAILDIDFFKNVNDTYGHSMGDKIIINIAQIIRNNVRKDDIVCRFGGEEFVIIIRDNIDVLLKVSQRIKESVEQSEVEGVKTTISIGLSTGSSNYDALFEESDKALYQAKANGRNRIECYQLCNQ